MRILKLSILTLILTLVGCVSESKSESLENLTYTVFNYSADDFANIRLSDQGSESVEGAKYLGSYENSGEYCCININLNKKIYVDYYYVKNGNSQHKKTHVRLYNKDKDKDKDKDKKNAILHILPNEYFLLEFTDEVPEPSEKILDQRLDYLKIKRKELDEPSTWRLKNE